MWLVEFMYLVFTRMPGESYCRRLRSLLLCLRYYFRALINSLVWWSEKARRASSIQYSIVSMNTTKMQLSRKRVFSVLTSLTRVNDWWFEKARMASSACFRWLHESNDPSGLVPVRSGPCTLPIGLVQGYFRWLHRCIRCCCWLINWFNVELSRKKYWRG